MSNLEEKIICKNCGHFEKERNVCHLCTDYDSTINKDGSGFDVFKTTSPNNRCSHFRLGAMDVMLKYSGNDDPASFSLLHDENGAPLIVDFSDVPGLKEQLEKEEKSKLGGCYIATAVYGSYDASEVLTLRRFRDEVLQNNIFGRLFIKIYYALSPSFAKRLKSMKHLNLWVRRRLDYFVEYLRNRFNY